MCISRWTRRRIAMQNAGLASRREFLQTVAATVGAGTLLSRGTAMGDDTKPPRIIDPHVHVWKNDPRYPWPKELANPPKEDALPSTLLQLMKAHGVEKTVIV